eukprot:366564-Chlamydomonas_euryale.AAC.24
MPVVDCQRGNLRGRCHVQRGSRRTGSYVVGGRAWGLLRVDCRLEREQGSNLGRAYLDAGRSSPSGRWAPVPHRRGGVITDIWPAAAAEPPVSPPPQWRWRQLQQRYRLRVGCRLERDQDVSSFRTCAVFF